MACLVVSDVKNVHKQKQNPCTSFAGPHCLLLVSLSAVVRTNASPFFETNVVSKRNNVTQNAMRRKLRRLVGHNKKKTRFGSLENSDQVRNPDRNGTKELTPLRMAQH